MTTTPASLLAFALHPPAHSAQVTKGMQAGTVREPLDQGKRVWSADKVHTQIRSIVLDLKRQ